MKKLSENEIDFIADAIILYPATLITELAVLLKLAEDNSPLSKVFRWFVILIITIIFISTSIILVGVYS